MTAASLGPVRNVGENCELTKDLPKEKAQGQSLCRREE